MTTSFRFAEAEEKPAMGRSSSAPTGADDESAYGRGVPRSVSDYAGKDSGLDTSVSEDLFYPSAAAAAAVTLSPSFGPSSISAARDNSSFFSGAYLNQSNNGSSTWSSQGQSGGAGLGSVVGRKDDAMSSLGLPPVGGGGSNANNSGASDLMGQMNGQNPQKQLNEFQLRTLLAASGNNGGSSQRGVMESQDDYRLRMAMTGLNVGNNNQQQIRALFGGMNGNGGMNGIGGNGSSGSNQSNNYFTSNDMGNNSGFMGGNNQSGNSMYNGGSNQYGQNSSQQQRFVDNSNVMANLTRSSSGGGNGGSGASSLAPVMDQRYMSNGNSAMMNQYSSMMQQQQQQDFYGLNNNGGGGNNYSMMLGGNNGMQQQANLSRSMSSSSSMGNGKPQTALMMMGNNGNNNGGMGIRRSTSNPNVPPPQQSPPPLGQQHWGNSGQQMQGGMGDYLDDGYGQMMNGNNNRQPRSSILEELRSAMRATSNTTPRNRAVAGSSAPMGMPGLTPQQRNAMLSSMQQQQSNQQQPLNTSNINITLQDVRGHAVELAQDQFGSRWLQQQLSSPLVSQQDKQNLFRELLPAAKHLASDTFGNYTVQIILNPQVGSPEQQRQLCAAAFEGNMLELSRDPFACRCVQSLIKLFQMGDSVIPVARQDAMLRELESDILTLVTDSNANHVAQQVIERIRPIERIDFILDAFRGHYVQLARDPYGCRVCQRVLEHGSVRHVEPALDELLADIDDLVKDSMGNYVVQHVITASGDKYRKQRARLVGAVKERLLEFATHKFASNVVEKVLEHGDQVTRREIIQIMLDGQAPAPNGSSAIGATVPMLQVMMSDLFANYVCQRSLNVADRDQLVRLVAIVRASAHELRRMTYGKHILSACEKAAAAAGIP